MLQNLGGTLMEENSRMDTLINNLSMFLNEVDKDTMKVAIYKKEVIRLKRYLNMMDIPVDIVNEKELKKGSVRITIKKRG